MTSYDSLPPIVEGELLDIHLRRARVLTVSGDRRYLQVETPTGYRLLIDRTRLDIDRVAPKEWPPQTGDIWVDGRGCEFLGHVHEEPGEDPVHQLISMDNPKGLAYAEDALQSYGPMRLVRRRGWSPHPLDAEIVDEESVEVDERALVVGGLRALGDFLDARPDLPVPHVGASVYPSTVDELTAIAARLGVEVRDRGTGLQADLAFGPVSYSAWATKPAPAADLSAVADAIVDEPDVDTWEHEGGRSLVDDGDGDANDPHCSSWMKEPTVDHTHRCALYANAAPHGEKHVCAVDGCGREWTDDDRDEPSLPADLGQHDVSDFDRGIL